MVLVVVVGSLYPVMLQAGQAGQAGVWEGVCLKVAQTVTRAVPVLGHEQVKVKKVFVLTWVGGFLIVIRP